MTNMKRLLGAIAIATLTATAASAQMAGPPNRSTAEVVPDHATRHGYVAFNPAFGAYAADRAVITADPSWVVEGGRIVGRDPDPAVRLQLEKDSNLADY